MWAFVLWCILKRCWLGLPEMYTNWTIQPFVFPSDLGPGAQGKTQSHYDCVGSLSSQVGHLYFCRAGKFENQIRGDVLLAAALGCKLHLHWTTWSRVCSGAHGILAQTFVTLLCHFGLLTRWTPPQHGMPTNCCWHLYIARIILMFWKVRTLQFVCTHIYLHINQITH